MVRAEVVVLPTLLLPVSLVPHRLLGVGWSPSVGWHPARPGCRNLDLRSPLLTCLECYVAAPTQFQARTLVVPPIFFNQLVDNGSVGVLPCVQSNG